MIFYFSGTGNSKWIANQLSNELQEELVFIPDALKHESFSYSLKVGEKVGFVFPIYSWAPPEIVLHFIRGLNLNNYKEQYFYFVCSCGDDTGLAQQVFEKVFKSKGWKCNAGFSVIMPNSYVLFPGFDIDSKELEQSKLEKAVCALDVVVNRIKNKEDIFLCNEGLFPYFKTRIINPLFNRFQMSPLNFRVMDTCVSCKRCEKSCPVGNISLVEGRPVWRMNCTSCLACYHVCPQQAVQYGKKTKDKGQYFNPNV